MRPIGEGLEERTLLSVGLDPEGEKGVVLLR